MSLVRKTKTCRITKRMQRDEEEENPLLKAFEKLCEFVSHVKQLDDTSYTSSAGKKYVPSELYEFMAKTTLSRASFDHMQKNVDTVLQWIHDNNEFMESNDKKDVPSDSIIRWEDSEKCYIPIGRIINSLQRYKDRDLLRAHFRAIRAYYNGDTAEIESLRRQYSKADSNDNMIESIVGNLLPNSSAGNMVSKLVRSVMQTFTDEDGELNVQVSDVLSADGIGNIVNMVKSSIEGENLEEIDPTELLAAQATASKKLFGEGSSPISHALVESLKSGIKISDEESDDEES